MEREQLPPAVAELVREFPVVVTTMVAWGDMDANSHVNNVIYFRYIEHARLHYFGLLGFSRMQQETGIGPILAWADCRFRLRVTYPDTVSIATRIVDVEAERFAMDSIIVSHATRPRRGRRQAARRGLRLSPAPQSAAARGNSPADRRVRAVELIRFIHPYFEPRANGQHHGRSNQSQRQSGLDHRRRTRDWQGDHQEIRRGRRDGGHRQPQDGKPEDDRRRVRQAGRQDRADRMPRRPQGSTRSWWPRSRRITARSTSW